MAPARIVDPDNDERRQLPSRNHGLDRFVNAPLHPIQDSCRRVKEVLPVVQVENRVTPCLVFGCVVVGGKQHAKRPRVTENSTREHHQAKVSDHALGSCGS